MANIINAITTGAGGLSTTADASGSIQIATNNGTTAMTIDTSQNVGIGTTSPSWKLEVVTAATSGIRVSTADFGMIQATNGTVVTKIQNGGTVGIIGTDTNHALDLHTNNAGRMRIDSSGNVLVNTTTAVSRLTVKASVNDYTGSLSLVANNSSNYWAFLHDGSNSRLFFGFNAVSKSYIDSSSGAYTAVSDSRLKENVIPLSSGLSEVLKLNPVTYNFISDENKAKQIGLIAQEVLPVIPEVVGVPTDIEKDNYGLNYAGLTPILVKAIQEQQTIINDLKARITALEGAK
jgi:hypothetical protein